MRSIFKALSVFVNDFQIRVQADGRVKFIDPELFRDWRDRMKSNSQQIRPVMPSEGDPYVQIGEMIRELEG